MKKIFVLLVALCLFALTAVPAFAAGEPLDAPTAIYYSVYSDDFADRLLVSVVLPDEISRMTSLSGEELKKMYGVDDALVFIQADYAIDKGKWHVSDSDMPEDSDFSDAVQPGEIFRNTQILNLADENARKAAGKLCKKDGDRYTLDLKNHTLKIRVRLVAKTYTNGLLDIRFSDWTKEMTVKENPDFGKTDMTLPVPNVEQAELAFFENNGQPYVKVVVSADESFRKTAAKLSVAESIYVNLTCQADIGPTGEYDEVQLDSGTNSLSLEPKKLYFNETQLDDEFSVKLRFKYFAYTSDGVIESEWSEPKTVKVPRWTEKTGVTHAKCKVCGFCHPIFGVCDFIIAFAAIILAVIIIVPVHMVRAKKKGNKNEDKK